MWVVLVVLFLVGIFAKKKVIPEPTMFVWKKRTHSQSQTQSTNFSKATEMSRWNENPDEIVLEGVKMFHLESMNERTLWIGVYGENGKIYHLNISANGDKLRYYWSDETV